MSCLISMPVAAIEHEITATIYDATFNVAEDNIGLQAAGMLEHKLYLPENYIFSYEYSDTGEFYSINNGDNDFLSNRLQYLSVNIGRKFNLLENAYLSPSIGIGGYKASYGAAPESHIPDNKGPLYSGVFKLDAGLNFNRHNLSAEIEAWYMVSFAGGSSNDFNSVTASYRYEYASGFYIGAGLLYIYRDYVLTLGTHDSGIDPYNRSGDEKSLSPFIDLKFIF